MANLHYVSLHEPTGLQYLKCEGFLAADAGNNDYTWHQQLYLDEQGEPRTEEVLRVDRCVVWSRNGSIKRVFNVDFEGEVISHAFTTSFPVGPVNDANNEKEASSSTKEDALVVILKTQAHIFCLGGEVHVIPLSFPVAKALPCSFGCIIQPALSSKHFATTASGGTSTSHWEHTPSQSSIASYLFNNVKHSTTVAQPQTRLPTYCISDLLSEVRLVAASPSRKLRDLDDCPVLTSAAELIFASTNGCLSQKSFRGVCIAVSFEQSTSEFTIWQVVDVKDGVNTQRAKDRTSTLQTRQSSHIHERSGIARPRQPSEHYRESGGGLLQSFIDDDPKPHSSQLSSIEHLAAELGQSFEPAGVQTRSARRISSMMARTDLAQANDRSVYNEANATSRKSLTRNLRKEGSIGSFSERRSFGGRKSFQTSGSTYSTATSFLDPASRLSFGDSIGPGLGEVDNTMTLETHEKGLVMLKLKSFRGDDKTNSSGAVKVLLVPHPDGVSHDRTLQQSFLVCILETQPQTMTVVTVGINSLSPRAGGQTNLMAPELKALQMQKGTSIVDAVLCSDGPVTRLLVLTKTSQGDDVLHLESPWSSSFRLTLPHQIKSLREQQISSFRSTFALNTFVYQDLAERDHEMQLNMLPRKHLIWQTIQLSRFVLPTHLQDSMLVAYWEIEAWLVSQDQAVLPNTALAIMLCSLAVPFINATQSKSSTPGRKRKGHRNDVSTGYNTASRPMLIDQKMRCSPAWLERSAWRWVGEATDRGKEDGHISRTRSDKYRLVHDSDIKFWLITCTDMTRDFLQSPAGENMTGTEGFLPTAVNQDWNLRRTALATIVVALYLLLEEVELGSNRASSTVSDHLFLAALLAQLSSWMDWQNWTRYMQSKLVTSGPDFASFVLDKAVIDGMKVPPEPFLPVDLAKHLSDTWSGRVGKYHTLTELVQGEHNLRSHTPLVLESARLLPKTTAALASQYEPTDQAAFLSLSHALSEIYAWHKFDATTKADFDTKMNHAHESRPVNNVMVADHLPHLALRDVHVMCNQALDIEGLGKWDVSSELDRQTITKLIFSHDRRFQEATRLVNQSRPPEVEYDPQPTWTEADALEAQKLLAQYATRRTFAVVSGRGLIYFNARTPLLTESVPRAQFSMQCVLRSKSDVEGGQSMTFSADRSLFTEDKVSWAFFHIGTSNGLMISKKAQFIDTSWILYNKPHELNNRHAGFLLALGLNGHLKNLAKWVAFKYLTPKHTMTSIGLLLGLAVSYKGSSDSSITRLLSVHATCMLPPGASELNISPLIQTSSLVGIGLLYHNTRHRRMSDVMMNEIESQEPEEETGDDAILRNEGYRLAAGMALGLINLGHGLKLHSLHGMGVVERLLTIAVGTKNVHLVHMLDRATAGAVIAIALIFLKTNNWSIASKIDIPDTQNQFDYVRPDIFLLRTLARHLIMWDHIRPAQDFIKESLPKQHRHHAGLKSVKRLITNDLPFFHVVAGICFALALKFAGSLRTEVRDLLLEYLDEFMRLSTLPSLSYDSNVTLNGVRNCLDLLALSCATVMAGSGDLNVYRRLRALHGRIDKDTPYGSHLAAHMAIGALFLSGGMATFNTSNIAVASLVMAFYPLFPIDELDNRAHLQALRHLWVLAVQHRCLILRDVNGGNAVEGVDARLTMQDGSQQVIRTPGLLPPLEEIHSISVIAEHFWPEVQPLDEYVNDPDQMNTLQTPRKRRDLYATSEQEITIALHRRALCKQPNLDPFDAAMRALTLQEDIPNFQSYPTAADATPIVQHPVDWVFEQQALSGLRYDEQELVVGDERSSDVRGLTTTLVDTHLQLSLGIFGPDHIGVRFRQPVEKDKLWQVRLLLSWSDLMAKEAAIGQCEVKTAPASAGTGQVWLKKNVIEMLRWRAWKLGRNIQGMEDAHSAVADAEESKQEVR